MDINYETLPCQNGGAVSSCMSSRQSGPLLLLLAEAVKTEEGVVEAEQAEVPPSRGADEGTRRQQAVPSSRAVAAGMGTDRDGEARALAVACQESTRVLLPAAASSGATRLLHHTDDGFADAAGLGLQGKARQNGHPVAAALQTVAEGGGGT